MASTSLQVLYFRLLKSSKVLNHLTKYLLEYKTVSIPHVGTLQLVQQSPQLNVVDKILLPPTYLLEIKNGEEVSDHQLNYLAAILQKGKDAVTRDLRFYGDKLQHKINGPGFTWEGFGTITRSTQSIPLTAGALDAVPANRVMRQDARHKVLVGDHQLLSGQDPQIETHTERIVRKRSLLITIGWVVFILSLLVIAFFLYQGKFRVNASGSRQSPTGYHIYK